MNAYPQPIVRTSRYLAWVSYDQGRTWLLVHHDGSTTLQHRLPDAPACTCTEVCEPADG